MQAGQGRGATVGRLEEDNGVLCSGGVVEWWSGGVCVVLSVWGESEDNDSIVS